MSVWSLGFLALLLRLLTCFFVVLVGERSRRSLRLQESAEALTFTLHFTSLHFTSPLHVMEYS